MAPARLALAAAFLLLVPASGFAASTRVASVLPPARPAALGGDVVATGSLGPVRSRPDAPPATLAAGERLSEDAAIERANATLNGLTSMTSEFTQVGGDGRTLTGVMYMQRPGKLRFEYEKPSTLEIVSDGSTVLVRDRKLNTADPYPISQTPLKFLLAARIDLGREAKVTSVQTDPDGVRIGLEDTSTLGGTSRITLSFDRDVRELKRWRVVDPQGYVTTVTLRDIEKNRTIDPRIFMLNYMRPVE